jgi:hypothetical protein
MVTRRGHTILQASVNDTTVRLAPEAPVKELVNVLPRILNFMATAPPPKSTSVSPQWTSQTATGGWW